MVAHVEVERVSRAELGRLRFNVEYYLRGRPVVVVDAACSWNAFRSWNVDYLSRVLGDRPVTLKSNESGVFDYNRGSTTGGVAAAEMPFSQALALIVSPEGYRHYIQQQSMKLAVPELFPDVRPPYLLDPTKRVSAVNWWFGGQGVKSPLHYDTYDNLLSQVVGRKRVTLFPPDSTDDLYPAVGDNLPHCSRVNVFAPDEAAFPRYASARAARVDVVLEPGNMLFVPSRWWHAAEALDVSASVNVWWTGEEQHPWDALRRGVPKLLSKQGRARLRAVFGKR
jgi:hypothetical protein